jgi:hypothetical protein
MIMAFEDAKTVAIAESNSGATVVPVTVEEDRPRRVMVNTTRRRGKRGELILDVRPMPGNVISVVTLVLTGKAGRHKFAKVAIITEPRRGRPRRSQSKKGE